MNIGAGTKKAQSLNTYRNDKIYNTFRVYLNVLFLITLDLSTMAHEYTVHCSNVLSAFHKMNFIGLAFISFIKNVEQLSSL